MRVDTHTIIHIPQHTPMPLPPSPMHSHLSLLSEKFQFSHQPSPATTFSTYSVLPHASPRDIVSLLKILFPFAFSLLLFFPFRGLIITQAAGSDNLGLVVNLSLNESLSATHSQCQGLAVLGRAEHPDWGSWGGFNHSCQMCSREPQEWVSLLAAGIPHE